MFRLVRRTPAALLIPALVALSTLGLSTAAFADPTDPGDTTPPPTLVAGAVLTLSSPSVYPYPDAYLDTVTIHAEAQTLDGSASDAVGSIDILRGSTVVKSWGISASDPVDVTWDGRIDSKVTAGNYTVSVTYTNPKEYSVSNSAPLLASSKKIVAHTWTKKVAAWGAVSTCPLDRTVTCSPYTYKTVKGVSLAGAAADYDPANEQVVSSLLLPITFKDAVLAKMSVSGAVTVTGSSGHTFSISTCTDSTYLYEGACEATKSTTKSATISSPTVTLGTRRHAAWLTTVSAGAKARVVYYTVHVTYYTLS